ncbi:hypothetical protein NDI43_14430 [Microcoleus vaginatus GB2-A3]
MVNPPPPNSTLTFITMNGVADLWYERLNMPVREASTYKAWGFSTDFFHTLIKQRLDCYSNPDFKI